MGRLFLPGQVVSAENQGTFSDYHDNSGDGGSGFCPVYGCTFRLDSMSGIFHDNDEGPSWVEAGSRLSKN